MFELCHYFKLLSVSTCQCLCCVCVINSFFLCFDMLTFMLVGWSDPPLSWFLQKINTLKWLVGLILLFHVVFSMF